MVAVLRLGASEQGITEILAVAEHVTSIATAAAGLRLRADVPRPATGAATELIDLTRAPRPEAEATLAEIRTWAQEALRIDHTPAFWRAFASKPRLLEAMWAKHLLVLGADELDADLKAAVALAVAMNAHSDYWTAYLDQLGRVRHGFDDDTVVEIAGAVIHYKAFNTISHGMMLDAPHRDIVAADLTGTRHERRRAAGTESTQRGTSKRPGSIPAGGRNARDDPRR